jgi:hypothetical protein
MLQGKPLTALFSGFLSGFPVFWETALGAPSEDSSAPKAFLLSGGNGFLEILEVIAPG